MKQLYKYHPIRFADTHPVIQLERVYRLGTNNQAITFGEDHILDIAGQFKNAVGRWRKLLDLIADVQDKPQGSIYQINWMRNVKLWSVFGAYAVEGRQLFSLHQTLASEFIETDIDGLSGELLHTPYKVFYLYWGTELKLEVERDVFIDGTYIVDTETEIHCYPTCFELNSNYLSPAKWMLAPDTFWDFRLSKTNVIDTDYLVAEYYKEMDIWRREDQPGFELFNEWLIAHNEKLLPHLKNCINLVANSLLYFSAYPEDIVGSWEEAPPDLVEKYKLAPINARKRVVQQLVKDGYRFVKFVGTKLAHPISVTSNANFGTSKAPHRRRGFMRLQPCGKGRLQQKLVWVRPTWVHGEQLKTAPGKIYEVSDLGSH